MQSVVYIVVIVFVTASQTFWIEMALQTPPGDNIFADNDDAKHSDTMKGKEEEALTPPGDNIFTDNDDAKNPDTMRDKEEEA